MKRKTTLPKFLFRKGFDQEPKEEEAVNDKAVKQIAAFIKEHFKSTRTMNYKQSSYRLMKLMERCHGYQIELNNGDLIAAMLKCGYRYKISDTNSLNCYFNVIPISEKQVQEIINNNR